MSDELDYDIFPELMLGTLQDELLLHPCKCGQPSAVKYRIWLDGQLALPVYVCKACDKY